MILQDICAWCRTPLGIINVEIPAIDEEEIHEGDEFPGGICVPCHDEMMVKIKQRGPVFGV